VADLRSLASVSLLGALVLAGCGGTSGGAAAAAEPEPAEPATPAVDPDVPTSFEGATRTWEVTNQSEDSCTYVDVQTCPDGGDISVCDTEHLQPYPCPPEGIWGSSPWHIYDLDGTCWIHGEQTPDCDGPQCKPPITRTVDCPGSPG
jgi:hypothetical protein